MTYPAVAACSIGFFACSAANLPLSAVQHPILQPIMKHWLALAAFASLAFAQDFDILIVNGRIVDGTGNPSYQGDVGIRAGRIAAVGRLAGRTAARTIDAASLTVAPGFVDIHNHSDYTVATDGDAQSMVRQGVATMIFGEGGSAAPVGGKQQRTRDRSDWTDLHLDQYRHLRGIEPDLDLRTW